MKLLDFLQGKWLGHPLHPAVVHVPLGLWPIATVLDAIAFFGDGANHTLARLACYAVILGLAVVLIAVPTGIADWTSIKKGRPAWQLALYHLLFNAAATVFWAINLALRLSAWNEIEPVTTGVLATSVLGSLLVLVGGYIGSRLVFAYGIGVARQSKKKWRKLAIEGGSKVPEES